MGKLKPAPNWIIERPIAHRGYHNRDEGRIENSLSAFQAAVDAGFAIECDLQVSANGVPVVFHDPELDRLTDVDGNLRDKKPQELAEITLSGSNDPISTLSTHLELVLGRVPIVLELKGVEGHDAGFVEGVAEAVAGYEGLLCVMSFDHWICEQFQMLLPDLPRGLTAEGDDSKYGKHMKAMEDYDLQFVSYGVKDLPNRFVQEMKDLGLPIITWTVRDEQSRQRTFEYADQMTFEGFDPREIGAKERSNG